ncbi:uncharacterized protein LOC132205816 isoform X1 [Neocloeon triangulifer]|uniref:uncharacterized protein LOC132205816 isoform X1 n=1 Tax=Neocloeon triangulifer TaxID=2078957 RepID=UPI00286EC594|nr:uncharacterized protein LOC132205816 isoform X1 [Neocloeon triangulifer]
MAETRGKWLLRNRRALLAQQVAPEAPPDNSGPSEAKKDKKTSAFDFLQQETNRAKRESSPSSNLRRRFESLEKPLLSREMVEDAIRLRKFRNSKIENAQREKNAKIKASGPINDILKGHHNKVLEMFKKVDQKAQEHMTFAIQTIKPVATEIEEEAKSIESQSAMAKKLAKALEGHVQFLDQLKTAQTKRASTLQKVLATLEKECGQEQKEELKAFTEMVEEVKVQLDKAIVDETVAKAKDFLKTLCNSFQ